jgi:transposase
LTLHETSVNPQSGAQDEDRRTDMTESTLGKTTTLKRSDLRGRERRPRRNWTKEAKSQIVAAMLSPGANVSEIARQHEISRQHLYLWRRAALVGDLPLPTQHEGQVRAPVTVAKAPGRRSNSTAIGQSLEIEVSGFIVRVRPGVDFELLANIVQALKTSH